MDVLFINMFKNTFSKIVPKMSSLEVHRRATL